MVIDYIQLKMLAVYHISVLNEAFLVVILHNINENFMLYDYL